MPASHTSATFYKTDILLVATGLAAPTSKAVDPRFFLFDVNHGGSGRVSGTVKIDGTPDYAVYRRVRLFREIDGLLIREQWSDRVTGAYSFDHIDQNYKYTVVAYDYEHNFRAVIADNITPDAM